MTSDLKVLILTQILSASHLTVMVMCLCIPIYGATSPARL